MEKIYHKIVKRLNEALCTNHDLLNFEITREAYNQLKLEREEYVKANSRLDVAIIDLFLENAYFTEEEMPELEFNVDCMFSLRGEKYEG